MNIRIQNLSLTFDQTPAVQNISTTIHDGELVSLLGPSGCGKSTTLMLLAGLYKPSSGQIFFGEKDVTHITAEKRKIGMVFQNYALYPHLSVLKNIMFPLRMNGVAKKEARERAFDMAKLVQIQHLVDRKPGQLSGGQQQRVAIARALVKKPQVLLLDEPLSNLDARLRLEMREEIRRIQQETGITSIFVTHDQEEALSISDRVLLMNGGKIEQESAPLTMYQKPTSLFAARFIGSPPVNLLPLVKKQGREYVVAGTEQALKIPAHFSDDKQNVVLAVRPENLQLTSIETGLIQGTVTHLETIGRDTLLQVSIGEASVRALVPPETAVDMNELVAFTMNENQMHLFDAQTEKLLPEKVKEVNQ